MWFLFFLLLLLIFFILYPVIRLFVAINRARRRVRDMYRAFTGQDDDPGRSYGRGQRRNTATASQPKRKKIDPSVGEYAEWEEITTVEAEHTTDTGTEYSSVRVEEQVVDAEWEDLP